MSRVGPGIAGERPIYRRTEEVVERGSADFGLLDPKGRRIGFDWTILACTHEPVPGDDPFRAGYLETPAFIGRTQATRDGAKFGALTRDLHAESLEEARALIERRRLGSLRRYQRQFGAAG